MTKLTEEEQLELVMKRSLNDVTAASHVVPFASDLPPPQPVFKKPFSAPSDNIDFTLLCDNGKHGPEVIHVVEEQNGNGHTTSDEILEASGFNHRAVGIRSFTTASDFMLDADNRRSSPEDGSIVNNRVSNKMMPDSSSLSSMLASLQRTPPRQTSDSLMGYEHLTRVSPKSSANGGGESRSLSDPHSQSAPSLEQPSAPLQNVLGKTRVATNIGSIGCMSSALPLEEGAEQSNGADMEVDTSSDHDSLPELIMSDEAKNAGGGEELAKPSPSFSPPSSMLTPLTNCMDTTNCNHTPPLAVKSAAATEVWTPAEEKMITKEMQEEMPEALAFQGELSGDPSSQPFLKRILHPPTPEKTGIGVDCAFFFFFFFIVLMACY